MNLLEAEERLIEIRPKGTFLSATITRSAEEVEEELDDYILLASKIADTKYGNNEIALSEQLLDIYDFALSFYTLQTLPMLYKEALEESNIEIARKRTDFIVNEMMDINEYLRNLKGEKILT